MIPQFPDFKLLEYTDKKDVENLLQGFPTYSDFNFTSLHVWNVKNEMLISKLNGNLVVCFSDYITGNPFMSFLGIKEASETAAILIAHSKAKYDLPMLKLIPETVIQFLPESDFCLIPERDSFDYIYPVPFFKLLSEQPAKCKPATLLRSFLKSYPLYAVTTLPLIDTNTDELRCIFRRWADNRGMDYRSLHEFLAFDRLLKSNNRNISVTTMAVSDALVGFIVIEILDQENAICHFFKANVSYKGVYDSLLWEVGKMLDDRGIQYLNFEQDLGIDTLRQSKEKYKQHSFLKKYIVERKANRL